MRAARSPWRAALLLPPGVQRPGSCPRLRFAALLPREPGRAGPRRRLTATLKEKALPWRAVIQHRPCPAYKPGGLLPLQRDQPLDRGRISRLQDVVVATGLQCAMAVFGAAAAADGKDAHALHSRHAAQHPRELAAVEIRQPDVEQDHLWTQAMRRLERSIAVDREFGLVPGASQGDVEIARGIEVVVHDEDTSHSAIIESCWQGSHRGQRAVVHSITRRA